MDCGTCAALSLITYAVTAILIWEAGKAFGKCRYERGKHADRKNSRRDKMNLNDVAREVTRMEKGKIEINIAQTKEIMKCLFKVMVRYSNDDILETISRYRRR